MIEVNHGGWSIDRGWYSDNYLIDEKRTDYEIHFPDGSKYVQKEPFESRIADWNYDGQVYELFGAYFHCSEFNRNEFITPAQMISLCVHNACRIPGLMTKEEMKQKESLASKLQAIEKQKDNQQDSSKDAKKTNHWER